MIWLSAMALFGVVFFGSIRYYNAAIVSSEKLRVRDVENSNFIDFALAACAVILFVSEKLS